MVSHNNAVSVVIPLFGVIVVLDNVGVRLVIVWAIVSVAVAPSESATVTVQVTTSSGMTPVVDKSNVALEPMTLPPTVHSKVGTGDSSGSVTVAAQIKTSSLYTVPVGVIDMPDKVGAVFSIIIEVVPEVPSAIPSFGVTITVHCSPLLVAELGSELVV